MAASLSIITDKEFEEVARALNDKRTLARVALKTANETGSRLRWQFPEILQEEIETTKQALEIKGRAAHPTQTDPAYRLSFRRQIPISKLRSGAKKIKGKRLVLQTGAGPRVFQTAVKEGRGFTLLKNRGPS